MQNHWVMDYETLSNVFIGVFQHYKTDETKVFIIWKGQNDLNKFIEFLKENKNQKSRHISFNGLNFDSQITEFIIRSRKKLLKMDGDQIAKEIYKKAQETIGRQNRKEWNEWAEYELTIPQLDVFKLNHWDNQAKRSSLKWIQCSMDWHNVQDMPIEHTAVIETQEEIDEIIKYCINDVTSTKRIMEISAKQIALRNTLTKQYGINLYSASEPKISKEIFLYFLEKELGISKKVLRKKRTNRSVINPKDLILPYIKFKTPQFQKLLETFQGLKLDANNLKGSFSASVNYKGVVTDFGLGGVHGAKRGIYVPDDNMIIMTSDVTSFYPNLAIRNKWAPGHLPADKFCELYEWFFDERRKIPKSDPRNYVYKIILNATYGLSNDKYSYLYDPEFTMRITINGQLSLMMLYEMLAEGIPGAIPIMQNTDGLEMIIPEKHKEKYLEICAEWEKITKLELEHDQYQKMIVPDVNNYIAVFDYKEVSKDEFYSLQRSSPEYLYKKEGGKFYFAPTKCKGRFEFKGLALHKNKSFLAVRKALYYFFVHGKDPKKYLKSNKNILDYCGQVKIKGDWKFVKNYVEMGEVVAEDLQKTLRYYVSKGGCKIWKNHLTDGRSNQLEAGSWYQTVFNEYQDNEWDDYKINLDFYLSKINSEIQNMQKDVLINQLALNF